MKESYKRTLLKTFVWRVIATSITVLSGWWVANDWEVGLAVGGIDTVLKTVCYFMFERAWAKTNAD